MFVFLFAVILGAQTVTAPALAPITAEGRADIVSEFRDRANGIRVWLEQYEGTTAVFPQQEERARTYEEVAQFLEEYEYQPRVDPQEVRRHDELIVINSLRALYGLPPYLKYPSR